MRTYIAPILIISLILQGSLVSFPLVFVSLFVFAVKTKSNYIFIIAFVLGLILDSLYLKPLGMTSLFFLLLFFAVFIYERKFEINSLSFIFIFSFVGSMVLFLLLGDSSVLLKSLITSVVTLFVSRLW